MRTLSIGSADAFILVYDVCDAATFEEVRQIRDQIHDCKRTAAVPIVVVGNKSDVVVDGDDSAPEVRIWSCVCAACGAMCCCGAVVSLSVVDATVALLRRWRWKTRLWAQTQVGWWRFMYVTCFLCFVSVSFSVALRWNADGPCRHRTAGDRRMGKRFRAMLGQGERERDAGRLTWSVCLCVCVSV